MIDLNFELAPRPGMTASQRKQELDNARFVAVRNMAYMRYKDANGNALLTYDQTLKDRELVKNTIIQHEVSLGILTDDRANPQPVMTQQAMPAQAAAQPAAPQYPTNPQPQQVPQMMTPAYSVPPPPAGPATAQQAVQAAAQPGQQEAAAPTGRRRRSAGTAAPGPQPGQPAMAPQGQMQPVAPQMGAQAGFPAPPAPPAPQYQQPSMAQPAPAFQQVGAAQADLTPVLAAVAELGRGLTIISKDLETLGKKVDGLVALASEGGQVNLAALFHIYGQHQSLYQLLQSEKVASLADFRNFIKKYTGP